MTDGTIAFLGLGAMGARMAERLRAAGRPLVVWNRTAAAAEPFAREGVRVAATPREAAAGAAAVIAMVRDDAASAAVWTGPDGALGAMAPGALAVEMSTVSPAHARHLAVRIEAAGVHFAEAPVAGSLPQAEAGALIVLLGGSGEAMQRAAAVVEPTARVVHEVGPAGSAAALKLAVNTLLGVQVALMGEVFAALTGAGIPADRVVELLPEMPVTSPAAANALRGIAAGSVPTFFPVELMVKDLEYAVATAREAGASTRIADAAAALFREALAGGLGSENMTAVARLARR